MSYVYNSLKMILWRCINWLGLQYEHDRSEWHRMLCYFTIKEPSMTSWIMHDCMLSMDVLLSSHHSKDFCIQFSPNQTRPHQKAHLKPAASDRSVVESPQPPILPNPTPFCPPVLQCRGRGDRSSVDHTPSSLLGLSTSGAILYTEGIRVCVRVGLGWSPSRLGYSPS
jgi:hypothetical protein